MQAAFSLDFDIVKIDKGILWNAEKNRIGRAILENSVRMIRDMQRKILVEGVETEAQLQLVKELSVDYLQGFYFSKPVPASGFSSPVRHFSRVDLPVPLSPIRAIRSPAFT